MIVKTKDELVMQRNQLYGDLYQVCGHCSLSYLEEICRKINALSWKIYSFKGGIKNDQD